MTCFTLGKMNGLSYSQYMEYKHAVATYNKVESYNSNVSTLRGSGSSSVSYYDFQTNQEQTIYSLGLMLLIQNNPGMTFTPVPKN